MLRNVRAAGAVYIILHPSVGRRENLSHGNLYMLTIYSLLLIFILYKIYWKLTLQLILGNREWVIFSGTDWI